MKRSFRAVTSDSWLKLSTNFPCVIELVHAKITHTKAAARRLSGIPRRLCYANVVSVSCLFEPSEEGRGVKFPRQIAILADYTIIIAVSSCHFHSDNYFTYSHVYTRKEIFPDDSHTGTIQKKRFIVWSIASFQSINVWIHLYTSLFLWNRHGGKNASISYTRKRPVRCRNHASRRRYSTLMAQQSAWPLRIEFVRDFLWCLGHHTARPRAAQLGHPKGIHLEKSSTNKLLQDNGGEGFVTQGINTETQSRHLAGINRYTYMLIYCVSIHTYTYMWMCVRMCFVCECVCERVCMCMCMCLCVRMYMCVYMFAHACACAYVHARTSHKFTNYTLPALPRLGNGSIAIECLLRSPFATAECFACGCTARFTSREAPVAHFRFSEWRCERDSTCCAHSFCSFLGSDLTCATGVWYTIARIWCFFACRITWLSCIYMYRV